MQRTATGSSWPTCWAFTLKMWEISGSPTELAQSKGCTFWSRPSSRKLRSLRWDTKCQLTQAVKASRLSVCKFSLTKTPTCAPNRFSTLHSPERSTQSTLLTQGPN
ncbi:ORF1.5 [Potexvirus sp.]|uniref:ORF1.5 n=1 Tax=Potexvirus sp. TaxID=2283800 RepID=UPI000E103991|nr:ORF1.5 [Potexvirus sp.]AXG65486.1 ORF1.5 [Potexvirus sp.]